MGAPLPVLPALGEAVRVVLGWYDADNRQSRGGVMAIAKPEPVYVEVTLPWGGALRVLTQRALASRLAVSSEHAGNLNDVTAAISTVHPHSRPALHALFDMSGPPGAGSASTSARLAWALLTLIGEKPEDWGVDPFAGLTPTVRDATVKAWQRELRPVRFRELAKATEQPRNKRARKARQRVVA